MQNCAGKEFNLHSDQIRFKLKSDTSDCGLFCWFCPLALEIELTNNDYKPGSMDQWAQNDANWRTAYSGKDTGKFINTECINIKCQKYWSYI